MARPHSETAALVFALDSAQYREDEPLFSAADFRAMLENPRSINRVLISDDERAYAVYAVSERTADDRTGYIYVTAIGGDEAGKRALLDGIVRQADMCGLFVKTHVDEADYDAYSVGVFISAGFVDVGAGSVAREDPALGFMQDGAIIGKLREYSLRFY